MTRQGKTEEQWREEWGLDERGAQKTTHLIEATNVAHGDARTRVKHMKIQRSGGIESGRGTSLLCLFVDMSGKDPEITHVCVPRSACGRLGVVKTESDTSKINEGSCAEGTLVRRTNDLNTFGEGQLLG